MNGFEINFNRITTSKTAAVLAFMAFLCLFAPPSCVRAQKLKNVSGTINVTTDAGTNWRTYPFDSITFEQDNFFSIYYTSASGVKLATTNYLFAFHNVFDTLSISGSRVSCSANEDPSPNFGFHASWSYSRWDIDLALGTQSISDTAFAVFADSLTRPNASIHFDYIIDGKVNDSLNFPSYQTLLNIKLLDAMGKLIDSEAHPTGINNVYCPRVPGTGSYLEKATLITDSQIFNPSNALINFHFIISPGVYQSQCSGLPWISFDATYATVPDSVQFPQRTGTGWKGGGGIGTIQDSGTVFINGGTLRFRGIMKIDTVHSLIYANGEFYAWTDRGLVLNASCWKLGTGAWPQLGYSCNGLGTIVQNFLSSDSIGGFGFRIDSISFLSDSSGVSGIRIGANVHIPGVTYETVCGSDGTSRYGNSTSDIGIAPIEITRNGIGGAIHVSNVSILPFFCVKDMFGSYYTLPDSLSFGAEFRTSFIDKLAVSAGWVHGVWDAISINYQQATGGVPIGQTGLLLSGARGSASGWNNPPLKFSFGGTFDDVTHKFLELEGDLGYREPSTLFGQLKLSFLNVSPFGWQVVTTGKATLDWNHSVMLDGSIQEGTLGNGYVFNGTGKLTYTWNPDPADLIGSGTGSYSIPKLFKPHLSAFTDFINSQLPITLAGAEMSLKSRVVRGNITLPTIIGTVSGHMAINLNLPYTDSNFIDFGRGTIPLNIAHPTGKYVPLSLPRDSINVPVNTALAVIRIRSNGVPASSSLIDPSKKSHTNATGDTLAGYLTDASTGHGFWVLRCPAAGTWILSMPSRTASDTVDAEAEPIEEPLQFTASQVGKHVTLNWTPISTGDSADVTAYLDDSSSGYGGFLTAIADDRSGTLSFDLSDSLPGCQYYLYAARDNRAFISRSYSSLQLDNSKSSAFPPTNLTVEHLGGDSILLSWTPTVSTGSFAYAIKVTDANGMDSIYGSADIGADSAVILVQNPLGHHISLVSYGDGIQSCWSPPISATSSVRPATSQLAVPSLSLQVWPNPSTGKGELSFTISDRGMVHVTIFNLLGQEVGSPVQGIFDAGTHTSSFDLSTVVPGTYYCRIQSGAIVETRKIIIE